MRVVEIPSWYEGYTVIRATLVATTKETESLFLVSRQYSSFRGKLSQSLEES